jgi:hypothetical protein
MAYSLTKNKDGDASLGNFRGELLTLAPSVSDYAAGGYLVEGIGGATENTGTVGMDKVLFVIPVGGQGGYSPVFNPTTSKVQIFEPSNAVAPQVEVPAHTDLSAYAFLLLAVGY